jgi:small GTP-binding protein
VKGVGGLKHPNVKIKMGSGKFKADAADSKEDSMNFNSKEKFLLDDKMKEDECMFTVALCDKDEKVAVASVPMKEIKGKSRDKYYPMTSKKKGANPEIRLRFSVGAPLKAARMRKSESRSRMRDSGEEDSGSDRDSRRLKRRSSSRRSMRGSGEDDDDDSISESATEMEDSEDDGGRRRRKKKGGVAQPFKVIKNAVKSVTVGKLYVYGVEGKFDNTFDLSEAKQMVAVCNFEKQNIVTDPVNASKIPRFKDNFVFTVKDLKSAFKVEIYKDKEKSDNLLARAKVENDDLEPNKEVKKWYDLFPKKDKGETCGKVLLRLKFEPYAEPIDESDDDPEEYASKDPIGDMHVDILQARNLTTLHKSRQADPFCELQLQGQQFETNVIKENVNPEWNEPFDFKVFSENAKLRITILDRTKKGNEFLGIVAISLADVAGEREFFKWLPLQKKKASNDITGDIQVKITFQYADGYRPGSARGGRSGRDRSGSHNNNNNDDDDDDDPDDEQSMREDDMGPKPKASKRPIKGKLKVDIVEAKELMAKEGDFFCKCIFEKEQKTSGTYKKSTNPKWEESYEFDTNDLHASRLFIGVYANLKKGPKFLGKAAVPLGNVKDNETVDQWYKVEKRSKKRPSGLSPCIRIKMEFVRRVPEVFSAETEVSEDVTHNMLFKVILIGESGVGKTNLFTRFMRNEFKSDTTATIGIEFAIKNYEVKDKIIKVQLWDTAGQERYKAVTRQYYRGAMGAIVVYDITNRNSYRRVDSWIREIKTFSSNPHCVLVLLGNKCDLSTARQVTVEEATDFAKRHEMSFLETSALDSTNVTRAFQMTLKDIYQTMLDHGTPNVDTNTYAGTNINSNLRGQAIVLDPENPGPGVIPDPKCKC